MKRIFACILMVLLLSALLSACTTTLTPNDTVSPGLTHSITDPPAGGNNNLPNITGETGTGTNRNTGNDAGTGNDIGRNRADTGAGTGTGTGNTNRANGTTGKTPKLSPNPFGNIGR